MTLPQRDRTLLRLSAAICLGDWALLRALRAGAPAGEPDRAWREAVLQSHLFAGFPRLVEAATVLREAGGLGAPDPDEVEAGADDPARGAELFTRIYGAKAEAVRGELAAAHPTLERWIVVHAYGRVLARPGLDPAARELCAVACLAALGQDRQLASHVRGALHCGATADQVAAALAAVADLIPEHDLRRAERVVERFAPRAQRGDA